MTHFENVREGRFVCGEAAPPQAPRSLDWREVDCLGCRRSGRRHGWYWGVGVLGGVALVILVAALWAFNVHEGSDVSEPRPTVSAFQVQLTRGTAERRTVSARKVATREAVEQRSLSATWDAEEATREAAPRPTSTPGSRSASKFGYGQSADDPLFNCDGVHFALTEGEYAKTGHVERYCSAAAFAMAYYMRGDAPPMPAPVQMLSVAAELRVCLDNFVSPKPLRPQAVMTDAAVFCMVSMGY